MVAHIKSTTAVAALGVGVLHDEAVLVFCTHTPMHCVLMITGHFSVPFCD